MAGGHLMSTEIEQIADSSMNTQEAPSLPD
jgi:hypothetical protein